MFCQRALTALLCAAVWVGAPARAEPPPTPAAAIEALRRDYQLVLLPPKTGGHWSAELATELRAGVERLPAALQRFPGGPLEVELHSSASPLGMGEGTRFRPEWTEGRRRFHLYAYAEPEDRRASYRLERLTPPEREALWRQRAAVHAILQRWDDALGLSERESWRRLNGWLRPLERPLTWKEESLNSYPWAYSRTRGMASASLDLVTFAEEALVPAEAIRADAIDVDDSVRCQELSKSRFLRGALAEAGLGEVLPPGPCPAFEAWADPASLSHFEVLLVAASGRAPESVVGHLMFRPVRHPTGDAVQESSFGTVVQLVALTGGARGGLEYAFRGLTGGYALVTMTTTFADVRMQMLEGEQRTLRRFRLRLSQGEQLRLLERIWETERRGYWPYFFLTDNCGTAMADILNSVLEGGRRIRMPPRFMPVAPTGALDAIARVDVEERLPSGEVVRGPLLVSAADAIESSHDAAARAHRRREEALEELRGLLPAAEWSALRQVHAQVQSPELRERRAAYERLPDPVERALDSASPQAREAVARALFTYLAYTVSIERYAFDRAEDERLKVLIAAIAPTSFKAWTADEERSARQGAFEREALLQRRGAQLLHAQRFREVVERAPHRPLTSQESASVARADETAATLDRLATLQGELIDRDLTQVEPMEWLAAERSAKVAWEREGLRGALPRSGYRRTLVGGGLALPSGNAAAPLPLLMMRSAVFWEELGDQRERGLQPGSELEILGGEVQLRPRLGLPEVFASEFTVGAYRTLVRDLPLERRSFLDELGWGFRVGWDYRADRELPQRGKVQGEAIVVLDAGPRFARFTALGVGLASELYLGNAGAAVGLGPRVSLAHRFPLPGSSSEALRIEASYEASAIAGRALSWSQAAKASLGLDWRLGRVGPWLLLFKPEVSFDWERGGPASPPAPFLRGSAYLEFL